MDVTLAVSLLWAGALTALFGLGVWRRSRRGTVPLVGLCLFVTALITSATIAAVALDLIERGEGRLLAFASWGAFTAAAVFYATVLSDP